MAQKPGQLCASDITYPKVEHNAKNTRGSAPCFSQNWHTTNICGLIWWAKILGAWILFHFSAYPFDFFIFKMFNKGTGGQCSKQLEGKLVTEAVICIFQSGF